MLHHFVPLNNASLIWACLIHSTSEDSPWKEEHLQKGTLFTSEWQTYIYTEIPNRSNVVLS